MKTCICGKHIPTWLTIDGKPRNLSNRTQCLSCLPFKSPAIKPRTVRSLAEIRKVKAARFKKWRDMIIKDTGFDPINVTRLRNRMVLLSVMDYKCQHCSYDKYHGNLAFNHLGNKSFNLSSRTLKCKLHIAIAESKKCIILCHNCHGEFHHGLIPPELVAAYHTAYVAALEEISTCQSWVDALNKLSLPVSLKCWTKYTRQGSNLLPPR